MSSMLRFLWYAPRGHRIAPWRSPFLLWRIETYTGVKMTKIGFLELDVAPARYRSLTHQEVEKFRRVLKLDKD